MNVIADSPAPSGHSLSLVVIGLNEEARLRKLGPSMVALRERCANLEILFVDAGSTDDSIEGARAWADRILAPKSGTWLASQARRVGTAKACGDWIWFLDGDMEPRVEFLSALDRARAEGGVWKGLVAARVDRWPGGTERRVHFGEEGTAARRFGGAIALERDALLRVGSWSPVLPGREELELAVRLAAHGYAVRATETLGVLHYDQKRPPFTERIRRALMWPSSILDRRIGPLRVLEAVASTGAWRELVHAYPPLVHGLILGCGLGLGGMLTILAEPRWIGGVVVVGTLGLTLRHFRRAVLGLSFLVQGAGAFLMRPSLRKAWPSDPLSDGTVQEVEP